MKITVICIPTLNEGGLLSEISMHFGKSSYFTFIKLENGEIIEINVIESAGKHNGGSKTPAEIIIDSGVDVLICGGLGTRAISMLRDDGIEVFSGASGKVRDVIKEWKIGFLPITDENVCRNGCKES
jgi:predicted Fe-Mo cluster-binding NifX family protein